MWSPSRSNLIEIYGHGEGAYHTTNLSVQIAESFRRFGISPSTTHLLCIKVSTPSAPFTASDVQSHLDKEFLGEQVPFEDAVIATMTDVTRVRKIYKLNSLPLGGGKKNSMVNGAAVEKQESKELEIFVLGSIALRGATN
jgi:EKC/KEOPS complex subunit CGI121/TPRKB